MYPYILCYCGRSIGDLFDAYKAMKLKKYERELSEHKEMRAADPALLALAGVEVTVGDILDQLGLHAECCRTRMITQVEFAELA